MLAVTGTLLEYFNSSTASEDPFFRTEEWHSLSAQIFVNGGTTFEYREIIYNQDCEDSYLLTESVREKTLHSKLIFCCCQLLQHCIQAINIYLNDINSVFSYVFVNHNARHT